MTVGFFDLTGKSNMFMKNGTQRQYLGNQVQVILGPCRISLFKVGEKYSYDIL